MPPRASSASRRTRCGGKNFIKPKAMPYTTATGKVYDSGEFAGHMARAQEVADWDGFKKRAAAAEARPGSMRGIGLATYIEACGIDRAGHRDGAARQRRRRHRADRLAVDRAGARTRPMRRSSPTSSACRPSACGWSRATPTGSRPAPAPAARARSRAAAPRSRARREACRQPRRTLAADGARGERRRSGDRRRRGARRRHRPRDRVRRSRASARTRRPTSSPAVGRLRAAGSRPIPTARMSPRWRSIRRPARPRSSTTSWSTISA